MHKIRRKNAAEKMSEVIVCGKRYIKQNRNWFYFNFYQMVLLHKLNDILKKNTHNNAFQFSEHVSMFQTSSSAIMNI